MFRRLRVFGVVIGCVVGVPPARVAPAAAQATMVIESYVGERPADADRVLAPLRERLRQKGFATSPPAILALLGARLPLPGAIDPALTPTELAERIDLGFKAALRGDYRVAVHQLEAALAAARENPSRIVADASASAWLTKALAGLAFARGRLGETAAAAALMADQIRSYPEQPVTRDAFGPEAEKLYTTTRKRLDPAPRGRLLIEVSRPDAQIYLNEAGRGHGGVYRGDLLPGTYRVLVEADGIGRRYTAEVEAGGEVRLAIDWATDAQLAATARWIGFVWPRDARDRTAQFAQRFARGGALDDVIVVGIVRHGGRRFVVGQTYRRQTGALDRVGSIELPIELPRDGDRRGADPATLVALADYLAGGARGPDARIGGDPRALAAAAPRGSRAPLWASAGLASAAFVTGAYLVALDGDPSCGAVPPTQCPHLQATGPLGWTVIGGGLAAAGLGVYWYVARVRPRATVALRRSASGAVATIGWSF